MRRQRRRVIAQVNVLPYIDVLFVLLVIFMVTVPMLNQGVEVELPQLEEAESITEDNIPLILTVGADGAYYLNKADDPNAPVSAEDVYFRTAAVLRLQPDLTVVVKGDRNAEYEWVVRAISLLSQAGAPSVSLSTGLPDAPEAP